MNEWHTATAPHKRARTGPARIHCNDPKPRITHGHPPPVAIRQQGSHPTEPLRVGQPRHIDPGNHPLTRSTPVMLQQTPHDVAAHTLHVYCNPLSRGPSTRHADERRRDAAVSTSASTAPQSAQRFPPSLRMPPISQCGGLWPPAVPVGRRGSLARGAVDRSAAGGPHRLFWSR